MVAQRTCFISGLGAMGGALARGLTKAALLSPGHLLGYDPLVERAQALQNETGLVPVQGNRAGAEKADLILLAVKPNLVTQVLGEMGPALSQPKVVVSVAAGVPLSVIQAQVPPQTSVLRVMPNTPALVGAGAFALSAGGSVAPETVQLVKGILGTMGLVVEVAEDQMDAVTGLSGSGPAFAAVFIEALADGGVRAGLPRGVALNLSAQTVLGAAKMVLEGQYHPAALKDMVTSPGGTTAAGLEALENGGLRAAAFQAVVAAARRSKEMTEQAQAKEK